MTSEPNLTDLENLDLRSLIDHRLSIEADMPLEEVFQQFSEHQHEFMAVLQGTSCQGLCSRRHLGMLLGTRYGRALYANKPICDYLLPHSTRIRIGQPIHQVLQQASQRSSDHIYDDLLLLDAEGTFLGLIFFRTLVQLQTRYLMQNIEQLEQQKQLIDRKNRQMESDLQLAKQLQASLLPQQQDQEQLRGNGYQLTHRYRAAALVGGDFFFTLELEDGSVGLLLCDVMGHGVRSALVTAMVRALMETHRPQANDPGAFLQLLNQELFNMLHRTDDGLFVTALYLFVDHTNDQVQFAKAGHHDPLLLQPHKGLVRPMAGADDRSGPPLGLFADATYGTQTWPETPEIGDCYTLFTDGLFEVFDLRGQAFGEQRLHELLLSLLDQSVPQIFDQTLQTLTGYAKSNSFNDDVCLVGLQVMEKHR